MHDYKAMYFDLFNSISDAIELLQKAQQNGESKYISNHDEPIPPPPSPEELEDKGQ